MLLLVYSYLIFSLCFNFNVGEKCVYTVPTNGYTTTYEIECEKSNVGSGTNVPTQTQVFYDPTFYSHNGNNQNYNPLGQNQNIIYYTDSNGINHQFNNNNNRPCVCGTINCQCTTTFYYYPTNTGSSGCYGNDCLTYIFLNRK